MRRRSLDGELFLLPLDATQGAVMPCKSSVCPSVTLRYVFHTGWNTSKIISRPNSMRLLLGLTPTRAEAPQKLGWNRGGVSL